MAVPAAAAASGPDRAAGQPTAAGLRAAGARYITSCVGSPDGWLHLLAAAADNPGVGFASAILIAAQDPGPAASYDDWRAAGWQVRKDEHAHVWILAGSGGQRPALVFTRSQVRPARADMSPQLPGAAPRAGTPERAFSALTTVARRHGYTVTRPDSTTQPSTVFGQHAITIPAGLGPLPAAAALARELAYIIRDQDRPGLEEDQPRPAGESTTDRYGAEVIEADSAAWLVLTRLGLDPAAAGIRFPAARDWAGPDPRAPVARLITAAGERFINVATQITAHAGKILAALPPAPAATQEPSEGQQANPGPAYGQYPRRLSDQAAMTDRPAWPCPDQALIRANQAAAAFYRSQMAGSWAAEYLHGRGFGPRICRSWQLGYAPAGWTVLCDHLRAAGFPAEVLEQAGLARKARHGLIDYFRDRVMIPIRAGHGQIAGFAGRARDGRRDGPPKYLNTPATAVYHKDELLYGLPEAAAALAASRARPVLVEGYFDVIAVTVAGEGRLAGVAPGGTGLSVTQVQLLAASCDLAYRPLLVARDPDGGGRRAALRDYRVLAPFCPAATVPVLPGPGDPADIYQHGGAAALTAALRAGEHPLADLAVDAALDPFDGGLDRCEAEAQVAAMRAAARLLAVTRPADMARQVVRVAGRTGIPHWEVAGEFAEAAAAAEPRPKGADPDRGQAALRAGREFPARPSRVRARSAWAKSGTPGRPRPRAR